MRNPTSRFSICYALIFSSALASGLCHCRGYISGGNETPDRSVVTESTDGGVVQSPNASVAQATDFDAGPLSATDYPNPPARGGLVSPVGVLQLCLGIDSNAVVGVSCSSSQATPLTIAYERLVVAGKCLTTNRPAPNLDELVVSVAGCDGSDPNQRFGYKGGAFFWGQNPNRCLDTTHLGASGGALVAKMCNGGGNQVFVMHSTLSDGQTALPMGPNTLFMPLGNGFLGSDAGATAALDYNRTIFLFNDTFVNMEGGADRSVRDGFVHNTVGVMQCSDLLHTQNCAIKYYFGGQQSYAQPVFADPNASYYFWPSTGTFYDGSLYVVNERTMSTNNNTSFAGVGVSVARISNPQDTPDLWDIEQYDISHNPNVVIYTQIWQRQTPTGSWPAAADDGNYAYYYFHLLQGEGLLRMPFDHIADANAYLFEGASAWQYLTTKNIWALWPRGGAQPSDVSQTIGPTSTLGNINYDAKTGTYYFVGQSSNLYLEPGTYYATSPGASGPWSEPKLLYAPPQYDSANSAYINNAVCYASEGHPEMAPSGDVAFTYQCSGDVTDPRTFRQNLVVMPAPWVTH